MYLYKNNKDRSISVYDFVPDKIKLIEFKKKYLENIKSVILHVYNKETERALFNDSFVMFSSLDRKEDNGKISYIEETNNKRVISDYVNGGIDTLDPMTVCGDIPTHKSLYSGKLVNQDGILLFDGGSYTQYGFISNESILLTGWLYLFQPLLSNGLYNLNYPEFLNLPDEEITDFLKLFSCVKQRTLSLDDLLLLSDEGLICVYNDIYDAVEKSEIVLENYKRVQKKK